MWEKRLCDDRNESNGRFKTTIPELGTAAEDEEARKTKLINNRNIFTVKVQTIFILP